MNITAHQERGMNKGRDDDGMNKARRREKTATNFREAVCCPSAVVQGAARRKNGSRGVPGVSGILGKANSHFEPTQTGSRTAPPR